MSKLVRRVRRKLMGGTMDMRVYEDGRCRVRMDHPSDDPEIEFAMAGRLLKVARQTFLDLGLGEPRFTPGQWRSDPAKPRPPSPTSPEE